MDYLPSLHLVNSTHVGAAASTGILGFAVYRVLKKFRQVPSILSSSLPGWGRKDDSLQLVKEIRHTDIGKIRALMEFVRDLAEGKPTDDKDMAMEIIIGIVGSLPQESKARTKLTHVLINALYESLEHPPISFQGAKFQYRTADGSYNNAHFPNLGKAGTPYAKSIQGKFPLNGVRPDPGLLFDLLMKRENGKFRENKAGISSMLFYHATILIHDLFRTDLNDFSINKNSSYFDLAPLYGNCLEDQWSVRTGKKGLLKLDAFCDKRILGQPPGASVILVLYNRFHNYVAQTLLAINEGGRFSCDEDNEDSLAQQDEALFQTARLITGGLYINISMHDYLRAITNTHHSKSNWTLDPRVDIPDGVLKQGTERGVGNQVSSEFNLLYRFHSSISERDETWLNDFFEDLFSGSKKPWDQMGPADVGMALHKFQSQIPTDPGEWVFGGLQRDPNGRFSDAELVHILKESIEDPAGEFGPRNTPAALRAVEILGIIQSRQWQTASLNEFRKFFKLKPHETFEDITENTQVADALRNMYGHPDQVEAYPGLYVEDAKPRMDIGSGFCAPYTVGRAVLSDAVTLVRSDRFYTVDYNVGSLTNWGMAEVAQDYDTLGGSMFYKLIQRGLPGWFPWNSLHVMQPMYTKDMNRQIAQEIGTIHQYTEADPAPPKPPVLVKRYRTMRAIMNDPQRFGMLLGLKYQSLLPDRPISFMLAGDLPKHHEQRELVGRLLFEGGDLRTILKDSLNEQVEACLKRAVFPVSKKTYQFDFVKDLAKPVLMRFLADLFLLDLKTDENPSGSYDVDSLYHDILLLRSWGVNDTDPAQSWNLHRKAQEALGRLHESTKKTIEKEATGSLGNILKASIKRVERPKKTTPTLRQFGREFIGKLVANSRPITEIQDIMIFSAVGAVGIGVTEVTHILHYLIAGPGTLEEFREVSTSQTDQAENNLRRYILEIQRMTTTQVTARLAKEDCAIDGLKIKKGDLVACDLGAASRDSEGYPEPETVKLDRPLHEYMAYTISPHQCLGQHIAVSYFASVLQGVLKFKNLRPAPGSLGELKKIIRPGIGVQYLTEDWSRLVDNVETWKLHFDNKAMGFLGAS